MLKMTVLTLNEKKILSIRVLSICMCLYIHILCSDFQVINMLHACWPFLALEEVIRYYLLYCYCLFGV